MPTGLAHTDMRLERLPLHGCHLAMQDHLPARFDLIARPSQTTNFASWLTRLRHTMSPFAKCPFTYKKHNFSF
jgi:hypothetical protein